jgi:hypothetical protein
MNIPPYWAKREQSVEGPKRRGYLLSAWQWSNLSLADAQQKADARLDELVQKVLAGAVLDRYGYGDRPMREEVVQKVANQAGREVGVVTRNAYGALVLNAVNALFIDIDFKEEEDVKQAAAPQGLLGRLLGKQPTPAPAPVSKPVSVQEQRYCESVEVWAAQHPDLGLRIYRTRAGLRCLITNQVFDPSQGDATAILRALDSDPLYTRLCKAQECFRARLTAKPWRMAAPVPPPPSRYPWNNVKAEARYREWERRYTSASAAYAACRLIKQIGPAEVHPDVLPVLSLHDAIACPISGRELA